MPVIKAPCALLVLCLTLVFIFKTKFCFCQTDPTRQPALLLSSFFFFFSPPSVNLSSQARAPSSLVKFLKIHQREFASTYCELTPSGIHGVSAYQYQNIIILHTLNDSSTLMKLYHGISSWNFVDH